MAFPGLLREMNRRQDKITTLKSRQGRIWLFWNCHWRWPWWWWMVIWTGSRQAQSITTETLPLFYGIMNGYRRRLYLPFKEAESIRSASFPDAPRLCGTHYKHNNLTEQPEKPCISQRTHFVSRWIGMGEKSCSFFSYRMLSNSESLLVKRAQLIKKWLASECSLGVFLVLLFGFLSVCLK